MQCHTIRYRKTLNVFSYRKWKHIFWTLSFMILVAPEYILLYLVTLAGWQFMDTQQFHVYTTVSQGWAGNRYRLEHRWSECLCGMTETLERPDPCTCQILGKSSFKETNSSLQNLSQFLRKLILLIKYILPRMGSLAYACI